MDFSFLDEEKRKPADTDQNKEPSKSLDHKEDTDDIFDKVINEYLNKQKENDLRTQEPQVQQNTEEVLPEESKPIVTEDQEVPTEKQTQQLVEPGVGTTEPTKGQPDVSDETLHQLLDEGYDLVSWVLSPERHTEDSRGREYDSPCGKCALTQMRFERMSTWDQRLPKGYIWLKEFLEAPLTHGRIDDLTHPDCTCELHVTKYNNPNDVRVVTRNGLQ